MIQQKKLKEPLKNRFSSRNAHTSCEHFESATKPYQVPIRRGTVKNVQPKCAHCSRKDVFQRFLIVLLKNLPEAPGIYKMLDKDGAVIYIGKAKNIKKRVGAYFQKDYRHSTRTKKLLESADDIEFIQTDSELECLLLENNLIKKLKPKYNILMKDDKSYVYIKIDLGEDFPRIRVVRERELETPGKEKDKPKNLVKYFGPKLAAAKVHETLRILKKLFPFRHCQLSISWLSEKSGEACENLAISPDKSLVEIKNRVIDFPCLDYFIKRCPGPCVGAVSPVEYKKIVQQVIGFLEGKEDELKKSLKEQMMSAASQKLFEKAARLRDKLLAIQSITEKQKITDMERQDTDVINFTTDTGRVYFNILMIRNGKLVNQENFMLDALEMTRKDPCAVLDAAEILEGFLTQYYEKAAYIPCEVFIPEELDLKETLEQWLKEKRGDKVRIISPKRGEKNKLLLLSLKNAVSFAKQYRIKWLAQQESKEAAAKLADVLNMKGKKLKRIEGFDISHLGGNETVGSMVVFENGAQEPQDYRHFKLRTLTGKPDDYAGMEEILMRRFKYLGNWAEDKELKFKQPNKRELVEVKKIAEKEKLARDNLGKKDMLVVKRGAKIVGFGRLNKLDEKVTMVASMWVSPEERGKHLGYAIMKKLIARSKLKRVYINTKKHLEDYYSAFGFTVLHEMPEVMRQRLLKIFKAADINLKERGLVAMVYDASKHKTDPSFSAKPDLIVMDGGKGQLSTALLVLKRLKLEIPAIALAKEFEEIHMPGEKAPLLLEEGDEALKLLQRIRDEAHRFAISFQRNLHRKTLLTPQ